MAIKKDITVTVENKKSVMSDSVWIYQGDKNIDIYFTIVDNRFEFSTVTPQKYSFTIRKPDGNLLPPTEITALVEGKVKFTITQAMADELNEVGIYDILIHLYDDLDSRISIPEINFEVKQPLVTTNALTSSGFVESAVLDSINDKLERLDENGNYIKTVWSKGDVITKENLNKIENQLVDLDKNSADITSQLAENKKYLNDYFNITESVFYDKDTKNIGYALKNEIPIHKKIYVPMGDFIIDVNHLNTDAVVFTSDTHLLISEQAKITINKTQRWVTHHSDCKNIKITGGNFYSSNEGVAEFKFSSLASDGLTLENMTFYNACGQRYHIFDLGGSVNTNIINCKFYGRKKVVGQDGFGEVIQLDYALTYGQPYYEWLQSQGIEVIFNGQACSNIIVDSCYFGRKPNDINSFAGVAIGSHSHTDLPHSNIKIKNCTFEGSDYESLLNFRNVQMIEIYNCLVLDTVTDDYSTFPARYYFRFSRYNAYEQNNIKIYNIQFIIKHMTSTSTNNVIRLRNDSGLTTKIKNISIYNIEINVNEVTKFDSITIGDADNISIKDVVGTDIRRLLYLLDCTNVNIDKLFTNRYTHIYSLYLLRCSYLHLSNATFIVGNNVYSVANHDIAFSIDSCSNININSILFNGCRMTSRNSTNINSTSYAPITV